MQRAEVLGARTFAMRIWLKPDKMAALNVSPAQVRQALAANNFLAAIGNTKGSLVQVNMTANTDLHSAEEFKQLVVFQEGDSLVRLQDIADVDFRAVVAPVEVVGGAAPAPGIETDHPPPGRMAQRQIMKIPGISGQPGQAEQRSARRQGIAVVAEIEPQTILRAEVPFPEGRC